MSENIRTLRNEYNQSTQKLVGIFAAQLDDLSRRLKESVNELTVSQLEWQPNQGMNTIGMLLAHVAVAETWWINVAVPEMPMQPDGDNRVREILGIEDDGIPLAADASHAAILAGKTISDYFSILDKGRASVHESLRQWSDDDLDELFHLRDSQFSRTWVLYHLVEHLACHWGQILLLKHLMRNSGVLPPLAKK